MSIIRLFTRPVVVGISLLALAAIPVTALAYYEVESATEDDTDEPEEQGALAGLTNIGASEEAAHARGPRP